MEGEVKFYNSHRGFGFITNPNGGKDIYFNKVDIIDDVDLNEGDKVSYEIAQEDRGPRAKNVKKL